jgi:hypothetical protein
LKLGDVLLRKQRGRAGDELPELTAKRRGRGGEGEFE